MNPTHSFYRACYRLARAIAAVFYRLRIIGKENIPERAALVCANHSNAIDPFLIAIVFGIDSNIHVITKAELFKIPVISAILKKLGMIRVDRGVLDTSTIKSTLSCLKNGEKVVIFPEGTRVHEDDAVLAKAGAVKIAERAGVPVLPLFLPRKKPLFSTLKIVVGEPYYIEKSQQKRTVEDYSMLSGTLMSKIKQLNPELHA